MGAVEQTQGFHYLVSGRRGGRKPGAHAGRTEGAGQQFASHRRLFDHPDPRRIDVRASLRDPRGEWLVRLARQRVAVPVQVIVDVSASMHLGSRLRKIDVVADFVESLGISSFSAGDPLGMQAFDGSSNLPCDALHHPPRRGRGVGHGLAGQLRVCPPPPPSRTAHPGAGLLACAQRLGSESRRDGVTFIASDFLGMSPLLLNDVLDALVAAQVVPMLVWHPDEVKPPEYHGLLPLVDVETGGQRSLWMRASVRARWHEAVTLRKHNLAALFARRNCPMHALVGVHGGFDADALTRYFFEHHA